MLTLPAAMKRLLRPLETVFRETTWEHAMVLLVGAILTPAKRTVTSALNVMGLRQEAQFQTYHRVLNRAVWSCLALSRILLSMVLTAFVAPDAPVIVGLDATIERRRGTKIAAKGIYRDPVPSSRSHFVTTSGLRWMRMLLLAPIPWAQRIWALPFLTVPAPAKRYYQERDRRHTPMLHWARQMISQLRRWLPNRTLVVVADSTAAARELLAHCVQLREPVTLITRLRLDAALYDPAPQRTAATRGRPRKNGARQPTLAQRLTDPATTWETITVTWYGGRQRTMRIATGTAVWYHSGKPPVFIRWVLITDPGANPFEPQALLRTDLTVSAQQIVEWCVLRRQVEVTLEASRAHLGIETQRQWSDQAIARTTPLLLGLFSLVTVLAHQFLQGNELPIRPAAWYAGKRLPTFSDTLAFVRQQLWPVAFFGTSPEKTDVIEIPRSLFERLSETVAYAA
ncbi:MAG: transposase [Chloroflexaceae bacterium]